MNASTAANASRTDVRPALDRVRPERRADGVLADRQRLERGRQGPGAEEVDDPLDVRPVELPGDLAAGPDRLVDVGRRDQVPVQDDRRAGGTPARPAPGRTAGSGWSSGRTGRPPRLLNVNPMTGSPVLPWSTNAVMVTSPPTGTRSFVGHAGEDEVVELLLVALFGRVLVALATPGSSRRSGVKLTIWRSRSGSAGEQRSDRSVPFRPGPRVGAAQPHVAPLVLARARPSAY